MTRSKRMKPVVDLAKDREHKAAGALGESRQRLSEHQQRLEELHRYREDYIKGMNSAGEAGLDAAKMRDYRLFLERLNLAIKQQQAVVTEGSHQVTEKAAQWVETRTKSKMMDKVVGRIKSEEDSKARRQEQKLMDEQALRRRRID